MAEPQKPGGRGSFSETQTLLLENRSSWYLSTQDHAIQSDSDALWPKRMGAKITEIEAVTVSFISQPARLLNTIIGRPQNAGEVAVTSATKMTRRKNKAVVLEFRHAIQSGVMMRRLSTLVARSIFNTAPWFRPVATDCSTLSRFAADE